MSIELAMPKLGLTMKTGKVSKWFVAEGAAVKQGDDLFEVETDKITNKVESPADGVLFQIMVQPKQEVAVGAVLGILAEPGETIARVEGASDSPASATAQARKNQRVSRRATLWHWRDSVSRRAAAGA